MYCIIYGRDTNKWNESEASLLQDDRQHVTEQQVVKELPTTMWFFLKGEHIE